MENKKVLQEWLDFAEMDFLTAKHLYDNMYPKPLEIICYHCQQSVEKLLKAVLISYGVTIKRRMILDCWRKCFRNIWK